MANDLKIRARCIAENGDLVACQTLLDKDGFDIDSYVTKTADTMLMIAVSQRHFKLSEYLCMKGANVNVEDIFGVTALIHAIDTKQTEIVHMLCEYGANVHIGSIPPLTKAFRVGSINMCNYLISKGAHVDDVAYILLEESASCFPDISRINLLLQLGVNVNERSPNGSTALMYACKNGHSDLCKLFCWKGAGLFQEDRYKRNVFTLTKDECPHIYAYLCRWKERASLLTFLRIKLLPTDILRELGSFVLG